MRFQAQVPFVDGLNRPDDYVYKGDRPIESFVVSRTRDGASLSQYGDMAWDRSPYDPEGRASTLSFQFWEGKVDEATPFRLALVDDIRWITFILIYLRPGPTLSNRTLSGYVYVLRSFASYCEASERNMIDALASRESILEFVHSAPAGAAKFVAVTRLLWRLGEETTGFSVPGKCAIEALDSQAQRYRESLRQHPPLPTQIYSKVLENLQSEFDQIYASFEALLSLSSDCFSSPLAGVQVSVQRRIARDLGIEWTGKSPTVFELIEKYGLGSFWDRVGNVRDRKGLIGVFAYIQMICSLQIQAFTGMRRSEVQNLPLDCLEQAVRLGNIRYIVRGKVTKLTKGKNKEARWVTSKRGRDAVELAQRLAQLIYDSKEGPVRAGSSNSSPKYLFVSPIYLWCHSRGGQNIPSHLALSSRFTRIRRLMEPVVENSDLSELMQIDPHRHWNLEPGFKEGDRWQFSSHQLRRSLALYAQRSGLVSLPSLKRQLQHITQEMSLYYSQGASRAVDLTVASKIENQFMKEWLDAQPLSQFLAYEKHVLSGTEGQIFGGHVDWVRQSQKKFRTNIFDDRAATLNQFKLGKLAFLVTPVGGCTNPAPCEQNPIDVLHVDCVIENCKHLVGNVSKVRRMILVKSRQIEAMKTASQSLPEIAHEISELRKLELALDTIQDAPRGVKDHE